MTAMEDLSDRLEQIATFLAVLELIRTRTVVVFQRRLFDEIRVALREKTEADAAGAGGGEG